MNILVAGYGSTRTAPPVPLRVYRAAKGWSQRSLASAAGLSRSTVIRCENGENASLESRVRLAAALQVPLETLFPPEDAR